MILCNEKSYKQQEEKKAQEIVSHAAEALFRKWHKTGDNRLVSFKGPMPKDFVIGYTFLSDSKIEELRKLGVFCTVEVGPEFEPIGPRAITEHGLGDHVGPIVNTQGQNPKKN